MDEDCVMTNNVPTVQICKYVHPPEQWQKYQVGLPHEFLLFRTSGRVALQRREHLFVTKFVDGDKRRAFVHAGYRSLVWCMARVLPHAGDLHCCSVYQEESANALKCLGGLLRAGLVVNETSNDNKRSVGRNGLQIWWQAALSKLKASVHDR